MFGRLFRKDPIVSVMPTLYGAIVAQARQPVFYQRLGAPDTPDGRFEMIVLHLFLLMQRAKGEGERGRKLSQALFDHFISDMDGSLREMGVGDLTVPKKIKAMGEAFYGRMAAYGASLAASEDELGRTLARNILANEAADGAPLAQYVTKSVAALADAPFSAIETGTVPFVPPQEI